MRWDGCVSHQGESLLKLPWMSYGLSIDVKSIASRGGSPGLRVHVDRLQEREVGERVYARPPTCHMQYVLALIASRRSLTAPVPGHSLGGSACKAHLLARSCPRGVSDPALEY